MGILLIPLILLGLISIPLMSATDAILAPPLPRGVGGVYV